MTELLGWLRQQRLLYRESSFFMVHAGLLPQWSIVRRRIWLVKWKLGYGVPTTKTCFGRLSRQTLAMASRT